MQQNFETKPLTLFRLLTSLVKGIYVLLHNLFIQPITNHPFIHIISFTYLSIHWGICWSPVVYHLIQTRRRRDRFQLRITRRITTFMVDIVFYKSHLCDLLKVVCQHLMESCIILLYVKKRDLATMTNVIDSPTTSGLYTVLWIRQLIQLLLSTN